MNKIIIPTWVKTSNYRTMTPIWMDGRRNKWILWCAVKLRDEAVGLIRTYQQFMGSVEITSLFRFKR